MRKPKLDGTARKATTGGVLIGSDYDTERTRKMKADADIAEITLAKVQGELCKTEDVVKAWESVLHACKAKLLSMPTKVSPVVANETDTATIKQLLEDQIREALDELANYQPTVDPVNTGSAAGATGSGDETANTAPAPKRGRVGRPRKAAGLTK